MAGMTENVSTQQPSSELIPQPHGGAIAPIRTREAAVALAEKRWSKYRRWAEAGKVLGVLGADVELTEAAKAQAYIELVAVQTRIAMDKDNYNAPAAFRNVRAAIGADIGAPTRQAAGLGIPSGGVALVISPELVAAALARLAGGE